MEEQLLANLELLSTIFNGLNDPEYKEKYQEHALWNVVESVVKSYEGIKTLNKLEELLDDE